MKTALASARRLAVNCSTRPVPSSIVAPGSSSVSSSPRSSNFQVVRTYKSLLALPSSSSSSSPSPSLSSSLGRIEWRKTQYFSSSSKSNGLDDDEGGDNKEERVIHHPSMETEKDLGQALREVQQLFRQGQYKEALEISMGMKDWLEQELGEDHPVYASNLNNIALMHKMLNEVDESIHWYSQALHKYKQTVGEKHRSYAATLANLGLLFLSQAQQAHGKVQAMGYLESAEETLRKVLEIRTEILEDDDPALATTRSNLASVLQRTGRAVEAEDLLRTSLAKVVEKTGRENEAVATAINNLGFLLKSEGRLEEAVQYYQDSLAIRRKLYEKTHPQIIVSLNNIAELYIAKGKEQTAKVYQAEILDILTGGDGGREDGQGKQ